MNIIIYYFDRVTINTELTRKELKILLPIAKLKKHCHGKLKIKKASKTGKYQGYRAKIDAHQVTDEFIKILGKYDLGKCGIWKIEIAKDTGHETFQQAKDYLFWFERNANRKWKTFVWRYDGDSNDTFYMGNKPGKRNENYISAYPTKKKILNRPAFHFEFVLKNNPKINNILGINHFSELGTAKELFDKLENRYLSFPTINRKKVEELFWHIFKDKKKVKYCTDMVKDVADLRQWFEFQQENARRSISCRKLHRKAKKSSRNTKFHQKLKKVKVRNTSKSELYILNAKISDYYM